MSVMYEAKWTDALKTEYAKSHPENCAGPDGSFPIKDASDVGDAWGLAGHAADPDAVRRKIIAIAKRLGFTSALPDTAKEFMDGKSEESAATVANAVVKPRKKIATLRVCFLEYNARSLNGRIYPKATCDAIYQSGIRKLADSNGLPVTVFVSHEAANGNVNTELVGRASRIWQEGTKFYADLDLADTRTAWDMLALAEGQYLRSESMRVLGVELSHDRNYDLPLVVPQEGAENVELMGIDLTTRPGLIDSARILQTLYESAQAEPYTEAFTLDTVLIQSKEEAIVPIPLYLQIIAEMQEGLTPDRQAHQKVHDHLAGVLDATIAPKHGDKSESLIAAAQLSEEGRAIAQKHAVHLAAAHDESAKMLGQDCEGAYNEALGIALDPDRDGDDMDPSDQEDDGESAKHKGENKPMTEQEMLAALKAKGYTIDVPKTAEEKLAVLEAQIAEQDRKIAALTESATTAPPQRQTQALNSMNEGGSTLEPEHIYEEGDYLAGTLAPKNWKALANRRVPWPQDVDPQMALHELAPFLAHRLLEQETAALGRDLTSIIQPYERV